MSELQLGQIITGKHERDAIHVAVAPVVAAQNLNPGDRIGLNERGEADKTDKPIGIVDPYLERGPRTGEQFWLWLFPNTVTGMRHHWQHPAFSDKGEFVSIGESREWIANFAAQFSEDYDSLMSAASQFEASGYCTMDNSEEYKCVDYELWPVFWKHYENVTGRKVSDDDRESCPYSCSC